MKMLLFGASGLVGSTLARLAATAGFDIQGTVGAWRGGAIAGVPNLVRVDLMTGDGVAQLVEESGAGVIVNAAAIADPGSCDADPARSHRVNVSLPGQLAELTHKNGVRLIHLSSDQVFDGSAAPYSVGDTVRAINLYGRQKIESEQLVQAADPAAVTLRLPLLLGNSLSGRRSVHERLLELWAAGGVARLYVDEMRQTCTADSVAQAILQIIRQPGLAGVFHWAGAKPVSRFEIGEGIRQKFGLGGNRAQVVATSRKDDPRALASRQADLALNLAPLTTRLVVKPQTLAEALAELKLPAWWNVESLRGS